MAPAILDTDANPSLAPVPPASDGTLISTLQTSTCSFLQPPGSLHTSALHIAKRYLDPLAASTSEAQTQRQHSLRRKRKRVYDHTIERPLQLKEVYLDGFRIEQIWEQARRVLDASRREVGRSLPTILQESKREGKPKKAALYGQSNGKAVRFRDENDSENIDVEEEDVAVDTDNSMEEVDGLPEESDESMLNGENQADGGEGEEDDIFGDDDFYNDDAEEEATETFIPDKLGLNDGFFSIDDFNRQSEFLEQRDARGEDDGAESDEEDVDWDADPLNTGPPSRAGSNQPNGKYEESEDEEDGPTFGNADLNALDDTDNDGASDDGIEMDNLGGMNNTNEIKYADFFEPPPRKTSGPKGRRFLAKTQPPPSTVAPRQETEEEIQRTISAVRRDIFEDDLTPDEDEPASDANDARSSHQKRQAVLTAEIRKLEAAAVAKRDWTLSGEARAGDRPINSLLEEDLEFERAGKPIPVITQEVSEDIEALIKRRILAREFDEVIRRRPGNLATGGADVRRGRFELEDTKPQQSLAEVYEAEHLKTVDPAGYTDKRDEKLKREHAKIEQMWKDVSSKLDALSSWHYKPKPPSANIKVVADVPTISMEDARPAAGGDVAGESMMAPQEIYKAGEARNKKEEVVTGSGLPVGREEMTRDEKTRRRRREKERIRKAGGLMPIKGGKEVSKKTKEKQGVVGDLKRGHVRVIGKKGEFRDVEGNAVKSRAAAGKGAGGYKL